LTALGIVLGVAVLFGVEVSGASIDRGVHQFLTGFTGRAQVLVTPVGSESATLPAVTRSQIAALPGVSLSSGSLDIGVVAHGPRTTLQGMELEGEDAAGSRILTFPLAAGRTARSGASEVALGAKAATDLRVSVGDTVQVDTATGRSGLRVVGILTTAGAGEADNGLVAYTSLSTAEELNRTPQQINQVAVELAPHVDVTSWLSRYGEQIPDATMTASADVNPGFQSFLGVIKASLSLFAVLSLFIAAFLIYLTLSTAVVERTRSYGTLRALGATPRQIRGVVLSEALLLGVVSSLVGLALGAGIATLLTHTFATLIGILPPPLVLSIPALVGTFLVGLVVTLVSALIPARRAAHLAPVSAMKGGGETGQRASKAWIAGGMLVAGGGILAGGLPNGLGSAGGIFLVLLGAVFLLPPLLPLLARAVGWLTAAPVPGVGRIGVHHLVKERSRSSYTAALVMVVLSQGIVIGAAQTSMTQSLNQILDRQFGADIEVLNEIGSLTPAQINAVRSTPGIAAFTEEAAGTTRLLSPVPQRSPASSPGAAGTPEPLAIIDPTTYFSVEGASFSSGTEAGAIAGLESGRSVLIPAPTAAQLHVSLGGSVVLETIKGPERFRVVGTYPSFGNGAIVVSQVEGAALFGSTLPAAVALDLRPGVDATATASAIDRRLDIPVTGTPGNSLLVFTAAALKSEAHHELDGFLSLFDAVLTIAVLVSLLGLANTLAMSILARTREIGVLRAIGTQRRQVRSMVMVESLTLALVALVLSIPLGVPLSVVVVRTISSELGYSVTYRFPWDSLPLIAFLSALVAVLAALGPARRAGRLDVVEALQYE
jgi:putative ABC transport system permease protein